MEFHSDSNSATVSDHQTHDFILDQNRGLFLIEGTTFSGTFSMICHMHNICVVVGRTSLIAAFMIASSSVMISAGANPPIALRKVLNSQIYDSIFLS